MKNTIFRILIFLTLTPFYGMAQQTDDQDFLLHQLIGKWVLQGTIEGKETTHDITTDWVLDHQYIQIKEVSRELNVKGKPEYEAIVFISRDQALDQYSCLWLDNTGNSGLNAKSVGHAKASGDNIEFLFKGNDSSTFHTTFAYDRSSDSWQWIMDVEENGKLQSFASVKLTRK